MLFSIVLNRQFDSKIKPSQTRRWSRLKPNCYGWRQQKTRQQKTKQKSVEIKAYQKPSWVLASTNKWKTVFILNCCFCLSGDLLAACSNNKVDPSSRQSVQELSRTCSHMFTHPSLGTSTILQQSSQDSCWKQVII
jgi:hypothetical protein